MEDAEATNSARLIRTRQFGYKPKPLLRAVLTKTEFYLSRIILQNLSYSSAPFHHNASPRTRGAVAGTTVHPLCTTGGAQ